MIVGVDPGIHGAWAAVSEKGTIEAFDKLPIINIAPTVAVVDSAIFIKTLRSLKPLCVAIETVGFVKVNTHSVLKLSAIAGSIAACAIAAEVPVLSIDPKTWKARHRLMKQPKAAATQRVLDLFSVTLPIAAAEAALIAETAYAVSLVLPNEAN